MRIAPVNNLYTRSSLNKQHSTFKVFEGKNTPLKALNVENYKAIYFTSRYCPIYAINIKTGETEYFSSYTDAKTKFNTASETISRAIAQQGGRYKGHIFVKCDDIHQKDENGDLICDENGNAKIDKNKVWNILNKQLFSAINLKTGEVQTFSSQSEAQKILTVEKNSINACITGRINRTGDYIFMPFESLQLKDDKGKIVFDENGMPKIDRNKIWEAIGPNTICAVNLQTHECKFFVAQTEAAQKLNVSLAYINDCTKGRNKTASYGYYFASSQEVWAKDKNGNLIFDENNVPKINPNKLWEAIGSNTICAINIKTHEIQTFFSRVEASKKLNVPASSISNCVNGNARLARGYCFVYLKELWAEDENKNFILDENGSPKIDDDKVCDVIQHNRRFYKKLLQKNKN